jgi:hypothetical protein
VAGQDRMTIEEVVRRVLRDEHADVIRESVKAVARELMEAEVWDLVGAELGERRPEDRATHRNSYRPRRWDGRAGEIELQIPKLRQGSYFPGFLQPRKRSEQALVSVIQQAYVCGASTRRVDQVVEPRAARLEGVASGGRPRRPGDHRGKPAGLGAGFIPVGTPAAWMAAALVVHRDPTNPRSDGRVTCVRSGLHWVTNDISWPE